MPQKIWINHNIPQYLKKKNTMMIPRYISKQICINHKILQYFKEFNGNISVHVQKTWINHNIPQYFTKYYGNTIVRTKIID